MPKPKLVEVVRDIEALLTQQGFDEFKNAHKCAFIDRLLLLKDTIASAYSVDSLLRKSPTPVPASLIAAAPAPALASAPSQQYNMDIKYSVARSKELEKPIAFAPGIDAYSAMVGVLVSIGQGHKCANSVAFRTCFQVWILFLFNLFIY